MCESVYFPVGTNKSKSLRKWEQKTIEHVYLLFIYMFAFQKNNMCSFIKRICTQNHHKKFKVLVLNRANKKSNHMDHLRKVSFRLKKKLHPFVVPTHMVFIPKYPPFLICVVTKQVTWRLYRVFYLNFSILQIILSNFNSNNWIKFYKMQFCFYHFFYIFEKLLNH